MPLALRCSALLLVTLAACAGSAPAPAPSTHSAAEVTIAPAAPAPSAAAKASAAPDEGAKQGAVLGELDPLDMATLAALGAGSDAAGDGSTGALSGLPSSGGATLAPGPRGGLAGSGAAPGTTAHGPVVNVRIGPTTGTGDAAVGATSVVAGMAAGFRRCLNKALLSDPPGVTNGATLRLSVQLDPNGAVLAVKPSGGVGLSSAASACLIARVRAAQFAPPDGGSATLVIPVTAQVTP